MPKWYFHFHSVQNLQLVVKIRCYLLNYKDVSFFVRIILLSVVNIWMYLSWMETELSFLVNFKILTAYHHKLFLNISHVACLLLFVGDAEMTQPVGIKCIAIWKRHLLKSFFSISSDRELLYLEHKGFY